MTESWNESSGSGLDGEHRADPLPPSSQPADDEWPSFEDALRAHGFDTAPPSLSDEKPVTRRKVQAKAAAKVAEPPITAQPPTAGESQSAAPQTAEASSLEAVTGDDADAPVLPDVGQPAPTWSDPWAELAESILSEHDAPAAEAGNQTETAPESDDTVEPVSEVARWWLEPSERLGAPRNAAASGTYAQGPIKLHEDQAVSESEWPGESTWTSDTPETADEAAAGQAWPDETTWTSEAPAEHDAPATSDRIARVPETLPDHRPPTPPASLFARRGAAAAPPAAPTAASPASVPSDSLSPEEAPSVPTPPAAQSAPEPEAFAPWAFQPPEAPRRRAPASRGAGGAEFWTESDRERSRADVDAAPVDESWAAPGFLPDAEAAAAESRPYAFGAERGSRDDEAAEPSVDWYEAAALEVVGRSTPTATADTEFVGYEEARPPEPTAEPSPAAAPPSAEESHPHADAPEAPALPSPSTLHELITDDPWASQAFLDRTSTPPREPFKYELPPETAAAAHAAPVAGAERSERGDRSETTSEAWPAVPGDAWPQATADGWPGSVSDDAWSVPELEAPRPAPPEAPAPRSEPGPFSRAGVGAGLHLSKTPSGAGVFARVSSATAASDSARAAPPAASAGPAADRDLWQLVGDRPSTGTAPSGSRRRSFDPVSIFLTVLVAIVIVALLLGFLVFAAGMLGR